MSNLKTFLESVEKDNDAEAAIGMGMYQIDTLLQIIRLQDEALKEASESLNNRHDDILHYYENNCLPTKDELKEASLSCEDAKRAIHQIEELVCKT
jgi:hypothetical protein